MQKEKVLIIGAGLTGLYTATLLQERYEVIVIEARERLGGRIYSVEGHDMGPSWVWGHQKNILALIEKLGLEVFEQYTQGLALYDAPDGVQKFRPPPSAISYRIKGGISALIEALEMTLVSSAKCNEKVVRVKELGTQVEVQTDKATYVVDRVISTLPPKLAVQSISYIPKLSVSLEDKLKNIPTWMGYAAKCVVEYESAFWKKEGLSGFTFSHLGPLGEIHDASTEDKNALFGFFHTQASQENIAEDVVQQMIRLYGEQASQPLNIYSVEWNKESFTSTHLDAKPLSEHPSYGFEVTHFEGKLVFSGTESAFSEGGYLEGAIIASFEGIKTLI